MRVVRSARGAEVVEQDAVISVVLREPGAAGCLFDVLAACLAALAGGPRLLILGFAAGGVIAPLRAMGWSHPLRAVDLDLRGETLFRELCGEWCGEVRVEQDDAARWLRRRWRARFDGILEDLSVTEDHLTTKPEVSLEILPSLMRQRLRPGGVVVTNVLPVAGLGSEEVLEQLAGTDRRGLVVDFEQWENRLLLRGDGLPTAREATRRIREVLRGIGSSQADRLRVRSRSWRPMSR